MVSVLPGAIGLGVTVGAPVVALAALKILCKIKGEVANVAGDAAADWITETMAEVLVQAAVRIQGVEPEPDSNDAADCANGEGDQA